MRLKQGELSIQLVNIRSLRMNLNSVLFKDGTDIIVFSEVWTYSYEESQFGIAGYNCYFTSNDSYRAKGVAIFVAQTSGSQSGVRGAFSGGPRQSRTL